MKKILKGLGVSLGKAEGLVKIVKSAKDLKKFHKGNILVTRMTDPSMVQMMAKAKAIVCDIGGMSSHPSIVAREMGIPCIVNTKKATKVLKNNQKILVDGKKGKVYVP